MSYGFTTLQYTFKPLYCPENLLPTKAYFRNAEIPSKYTLIETKPSQQTPSIFKFLDISISPKLRAVHADHIHFAFTEEQTDLAFAKGALSSPLCQVNLPQNDIRFLNISYNQFGDLELSRYWIRSSASLGYVLQ